jgi:di/tricarboxylate transporter
MALVVVLVALVGFMLVCGWVCALIARQRGLDESGWWWSVGIIVGPVGWIAAALWPRPRRDEREGHLSA